jgi:predicted membrane protein
VASWHKFFLLALSIFVLGTTIAAQAATTVSLSPTLGHPSTVVSLSGASFGASEAVAIYRCCRFAAAGLL